VREIGLHGLSLGGGQPSTLPTEADAVKGMSLLALARIQDNNESGAFLHQARSVTAA